MWVFSKYGFYSVVAARRGKKIDKTRVCIRARLREHLADLLYNFGEQLPTARITRDDARDYRYRIVVPKGDWADVASSLAQDIDYDNFKDACGHGLYHDWLLKVWAAGMDAQCKEGGGDGNDVF